MYLELDGLVLKHLHIEPDGGQGLDLLVTVVLGVWGWGGEAEEGGGEGGLVLVKVWEGKRSYTSSRRYVCEALCV